MFYVNFYLWFLQFSISTKKRKKTEVNQRIKKKVWVKIQIKKIKGKVIIYNTTYSFNVLH